MSSTPSNSIRIELDIDQSIHDLNALLPNQIGAHQRNTFQQLLIYYIFHLYTAEELSLEINDLFLKYERAEITVAVFMADYADFLRPDRNDRDEEAIRISLRGCVLALFQTRVERKDCRPEDVVTRLRSGRHARLDAWLANDLDCLDINVDVASLVEDRKPDCDGEVKQDEENDEDDGDEADEQEAELSHWHTCHIERIDHDGEKGLCGEAIADLKDLRYHQERWHVQDEDLEGEDEWEKL